jgi:phage shock protein E
MRVRGGLGGFIAVAVVIGGACGAGADPVPDIGASEVLARMGETDGPVLLDVRSEEEFAAGHIGKAVNIPHDVLADRVDEVRAYRERGLVLYCERGGRAARAAEELQDAGYDKLYHLDGDMQGWRASGLPIEH